MKLLFDSIIEKHPKLYKPWVLVPEHATRTYDSDEVHDWKHVHQRFMECTTNIFSYKVTRLRKVSVVYNDEPLLALTQIVEHCLKARSKPLINCNIEEPLPIQEYQRQHEEQITSVSLLAN